MVNEEKKLWEALYESSEEYYETKPWQRYFPTDLFVLKIEGEEPVYCSITGRQQKDLEGLFLFRSYEALTKYFLFLNGKDYGISAGFGFSLLDALMLIYGDEKAESPKEKDRKKELGVKEADHQHALLNNLKTSYVPFELTNEEAALMNLAIQEIITAVIRTDRNEVDFANQMRVIHIAADGKVTYRIENKPEIDFEYDQIDIIDEAFVEELLKQSKGDMIEAAMVYLNRPVTSDDDGNPLPRPMNPLLCVLADPGSEKLISYRITDDLNEAMKSMVEMLYDDVIQKEIPSSIRCSNMLVYAALEALARQLDIQLIDDEPLEVVERFLKRFEVIPEIEPDQNLS